VLVSVESADDLPAALRTSGAVAHACKQGLSPDTLGRLWEAHGIRDGAGSHRGPSSPAPDG
jgi:hypothetical protein